MPPKINLNIKPAHSVAGSSSVSPGLGSPSKRNAKEKQIKDKHETLFAAKGSDELYAIYDKFDTNINDLD